MKKIETECLRSETKNHKHFLQYLKCVLGWRTTLHTKKESTG